jgi:S-adenosylmethionine:tRNA ribosyltransferase-isomerase
MIKLSISDFNYNLPEERIAKYPLERRDDSKLLVYKNGNISEDIFRNINSYIPSESLMIYNETKVVQARLLFKKDTGANIEIFCLEPIEPADFYHAFQKKEQAVWKCMVGNLKKWKEGKLSLSFKNGSEDCTLYASKKEDHGSWQAIEFSWESSALTFGEILDNIGLTPIPPYLKRDSEAEDKMRYQTIYSMNEGSVAAPTAGLHFTPQVFDKLDEKEINYSAITLHVGAGTFKPVKDDDVLAHEMHTEHFVVDKKVLEQLLYFTDNVTSVGTTSLRTLESIYWMGVKLIENSQNPFSIRQWDWKEQNNTHDVASSLKTILNYLKTNNLQQIEGATQIMITPGYQIRMAKRLITNFHQPKSTLLLLVCAFIGADWKQIYDYALSHDFRFLSFGDSSILIRE